MIRRFYLENENGVQFHFKYYTGVLLSDIVGLGFEFSLSYLKYGQISKFAMDIKKIGRFVRIWC